MEHCQHLDLSLNFMALKLLFPPPPTEAVNTLLQENNLWDLWQHPFLDDPLPSHHRLDLTTHIYAWTCVHACAQILIPGVRDGN